MWYKRMPDLKLRRAVYNETVTRAEEEEMVVVVVVVG